MVNIYVALNSWRSCIKQHGFFIYSAEVRWEKKSQHGGSVVDLGGVPFSKWFMTMKASFGVWHGHWQTSGLEFRCKYCTLERVHIRLLKQRRQMLIQSKFFPFST